MQIDNIEELINKTNITAFIHTSDIVAGKVYDVNKISLLNKNIFDINIQISVVLTNSLSAKGSISLP